MRLHMDSSAVGPSTTLLEISGVIDWSTITEFRASLARHVSRPRSEVLVDLSGLLSWSSPAQAALVAAMTKARLQGGRLAIFGLAPLPSRQARRSGLDRALRPFATRAEAQRRPVRAAAAAGSVAGGPGRQAPAAETPVAVATSERRRRRADASARWAVQRQQRWSFVTEPDHSPTGRAD